MLHENRLGGPVKVKGGGKQACRKLLIVEVTLRFQVGFLGDKIRVLNVHLHRDLAKKAKGFDADWKK